MMNSFNLFSASSPHEGCPVNRFGSLLVALLCLLCVGCSLKDDPTEPFAPSGPRLNTLDSLAMVNIYKAIGPWGNEWDLEDYTTWDGVHIALELNSNEYRIVGFQYYLGNFHGQIPEDLRKLTELQVLAIGGGSLTGSIPEWIGELENLVYLGIANNRVNGKIPESIGNLKKLQYLYIEDNYVEGPLPDCLGNLTEMIDMSISQTRVSGEIPKSLANMKNITRLLLYDNNLSGSFPIEILNSKLYVDCSNNHITELPFEVWREDFVGWPPVMYGNCLSGTLPDWVFETYKYKNYGFNVDRQKEGYGYSNYYPM